MNNSSAPQPINVRPYWNGKVAAWSQKLWLPVVTDSASTLSTPPILQNSSTKRPPPSTNFPKISLKFKQGRRDPTRLNSQHSGRIRCTHGTVLFERLICLSTIFKLLTILWETDTISPMVMARSANKLLDLKSTPAVQFRLGGYNGVLCTSAYLRGKIIQVRPSQHKFVSPHTELEVIKTSTFLPTYLNRQAITLLSHS